ncbi:MAG: hypothetical protein WDN44_09230 [Sphingomonas sp.]
MAINTDLGEQVHVNLFPQVIPSEHIRAAIGDRNGGDGGNREFRGIPWIFLWRDTDQVETNPIFQAWRTQGELRQGLRRLGVESDFDVALGLLKNSGVDFRVKRPPHGGTSFAVILGVWRPAPIMDDFFGYSADEDARRLELRSYLVRQDFGKEIMDDDATVDAVVGAYPPRPELMRWVAGVDAFPPFALFGYGALGSAIYNNLIRSGADDAFVQDKDRLLVHNFARHTGSIGDAHHLKVEEARQLMNSVVQGGSAKLTTFGEDIVSLPSDVLAQRIQGRLLIDATADELVRKKLDDVRSRAAVTVVRTEMFHEGRLGVTFVAPPGGPTLSELVLSLIAAAPHETAIAAWLEHEARHPPWTQADAVRVRVHVPDRPSAQPCGSAAGGRRDVRPAGSAIRRRNPDQSARRELPADGSQMDRCAFVRELHAADGHRLDRSHLLTREGDHDGGTSSSTPD